MLFDKTSNSYYLTLYRLNFQNRVWCLNPRRIYILRKFNEFSQVLTRWRYVRAWPSLSKSELMWFSTDFLARNYKIGSGKQMRVEFTIYHKLLDFPWIFKGWRYDVKPNAFWQNIKYLLSNFIPFEFSK